MTETDTGTDRRTAPRVLPWSLIVKLVAAGGSLLFLAAVLSPGHVGILPALFGFVSGLLAAVLGRLPVSYLAPFCLVAAMAPSLALVYWPGMGSVWAIAGLLAAGAGVETGTVGGRAFVAALYGWLSVVLVPAMPPVGAALPWVMTGAVWALATARLMHLNAVAAPPPSGWRFSIGLVLFLMIGLFFARMVSAQLGFQFGHWLVLMFVLRALTPQGRTFRAALRFGAGAGAGCGLALILSQVGLPGSVPMVLAVTLLLLGLRLLPHPLPFAPAAFTAAALLGAAPGPDAALSRLQAALIVVGLTFVIGIAIALAWRLIPRQTSP